MRYSGSYSITWAANTAAAPRLLHMSSSHGYGLAEGVYAIEDEGVVEGDVLFRNHLDRLLSHDAAQERADVVHLRCSETARL